MAFRRKSGAEFSLEMHVQIGVQGMGSLTEEAELTATGDSQESGQVRRAASAISWSSSRPTPLAAWTAIPKAKVVT
ncbi:hypothetical protein EDD29_4673 [Actinocorallia herbida]|uniref:Uncharacterized protein n=1 Tax=Actinocorallia herbida TaxID=58109 RepID=A0A3N1D0M0_9ACTN|nr:hypothetical protein EDD29_4673 [Actinocorallia herbida]